MAYKEYNVLEIVDVLRRYVAGDSIRGIARSKGMDRGIRYANIFVSLRRKDSALNLTGIWIRWSMGY